MRPQEAGERARIVLLAKPLGGMVAGRTIGREQLGRRLASGQILSERGPRRQSERGNGGYAIDNYVVHAIPPCLYAAPTAVSARLSGVPEMQSAHRLKVFTHGMAEI
jgi:hypothetical protein